MTWMLYGAYGTTGRMILREAVRRGQRPVLAGRDRSRLAALAGETGLDSRVFSFGAPDLARRALRGIAVLLNAAGPYHLTGGPVRRLCLEAGVSYVDVNGEIEDFRDALRCDAEARAQGVAVIPGAGYGVVFGEAIAGHVASRLPGASWMRISFATANAAKSRGAALSTASVLAGGGYAISGGELQRRPIGFRSWRMTRNGAAGLRFAAAPLAELIAAHRLTGVRDIVTGVPMPLAASLALRFAGPLVGRLMSRAAASEPAGPLPGSEDLRSRIWAEAGNAGGKTVVSVLETGEGYGTAAAAAVRAVEEALASRPVGAMTPAQAFGPGFALSVPGTRIAEV